MIRVIGALLLCIAFALVLYLLAHFDRVRTKEEKEAEAMRRAAERHSGDTH